MKAIFVTILFAALFSIAALAHEVDESNVLPYTGNERSFTLLDQDGKVFTEEDLLGKPTAVFFGFTFCPDVCPMTLSNLTDLIEESGVDIRVIMITIDPDNDTSNVLGKYLSYYNEAYVGLTGSEIELESAARSFFVTKEKEEGVLSHSASIYLLDKDGKLKDAIFYTEDRSTAIPKLKSIVE